MLIIWLLRLELGGGLEFKEDKGDCAQRHSASTSHWKNPALRSQQSSCTSRSGQNGGHSGREVSAVQSCFTNLVILPSQLFLTEQKFLVTFWLIYNIKWLKSSESV